MRNIKLIKSIAQGGLLLVAIAYSLAFVFYGFGNKMDPFFWLNKYESLDSGWMSFGTVLTGHLWMLLVGKHIVGFRLMGWACTSLALALPYCFLLSPQERKDNMHWLAISYLLMGYGAFQEFSAGTLTVPLFAAIIVCWVKYTDDKLPAWSLGLLAGLACFVRFPNIIIVLLLVLACAAWGIYRGKKWQTWLRDIALLVAVVFLVEGLGWLLWKGLSSQTIVPPSDNHTLTKMLTALWKKGFPLLIGLAGWTLYMGIILTLKRMPKAWHKWSAATLLAMLLIALLWYFVPEHQWYNNNYHHYIAALPLIIALFQAYEAYLQKKTDSTICLLAIVAFLLVAPMGSDTAWLKLFPATLCILPWMLSKQENARYALPSMLILGLFSTGLYTTNCIGNHNLWQCDTWAKTDIMRGICIKEKEDKRLLQIADDYASYSTKGIVYMLGEDMHLMRAITHAPLPYKNEFWSNIYDKVYTKWYRQLVKEKHPIFFCSFTPTFILDKKKQKVKESLVEQMLLEEGYRSVDRSPYKYMIYIPTDSTCTH